MEDYMEMLLVTGYCVLSKVKGGIEFARKKVICMRVNGDE